MDYYVHFPKRSQPLLPMLVLLSLVTSFYTPTPTESKTLQRNQPCDVSKHNEYFTSNKYDIAKMKILMADNTTSVCDISKHLTCVDAKCDCDPVYSRFPKTGTQSTLCQGLHGAPCHKLLDSNPSGEYIDMAGTVPASGDRNGSCLEGLKCETLDANIETQITSQGARTNASGSLFPAFGQLICKCDDEVLPDLTCKNSKSGSDSVIYGQVKMMIIGLFFFGPVMVKYTS